MQSYDRSSIFVAILLISLGIVFLVFTLIPGFSLGATWPIIFFFLAAGFFLPTVIWSGARRDLAGLFIPGAIMLALGTIFLYNTLTQDWAIWAYAWLLIPAGVGLGLVLASWVGQWGQTTAWVGVWMMIGSVAVFSIIGMMAGNPALRFTGPAVLILCGVLLLLRNLRRSS